LDYATPADVSAVSTQSSDADALLQADVDQNEQNSDNVDASLQNQIVALGDAADAVEAESEATIAALQAEVVDLQTEVSELQSASPLSGTIIPSLGSTRGQIFVKTDTEQIYIWVGPGAGWVVIN
jgi:hypothetical protein